MRGPPPPGPGRNAPPPARDTGEPQDQERVRKIKSNDIVCLSGQLLALLERVLHLVEYHFHRI